MTSLLEAHLPKDIVHNIIQQMLMPSKDEIRKKHRRLMKDVKALPVCSDCFSANCSSGHICPMCKKTCNVCNYCNLYLCNHFMLVSKL